MKVLISYNGYERNNPEGAITTSAETEPMREIEELRAQVRELTETLDAIRSGEVDAIIVTKDNTRKIYTLEGADRAYQTLVENIREGALSLTPEGIVLYSNAAFAEMLHVSLNKLLGSSILEHIAPRNRTTFTGMLQDASISPQKGPVYLRRGSRSIPVQVSMNPLLERGRSTKISVVIADRKQDEKALKESEAKYRNLFERMAEGFALLEMVSDESGKKIDFRFLDINPAFERLTGLKRKKIIGKLLRSVLPGNDRAWIERFGKVVMDRRPDHLTLFSPPLDRYFDVFAFSPAERQFAVLFTDITERKEAEESLRERTTQLQSVLDNSRDIIFRVDRDFRFSVVNQAGLRFFNLPAEQVLGRTNAELGISPEISEQWENHYRRVFETALADRFEQEFPGPDGNRYYLASLAPEFDDTGEVRSVLGIAVDVTNRKKAEVALQKSEERLDLALRGAQEGVWDWNPATGAVWYSPRWKEMLGYSEDEIEPHMGAWTQLLHPDDRERVLRAVSEVMRGESEYEIEFRLRHKDGHYLDILSRGIPVREEPGGAVTRIVGTHFDLTDKKAAEEALRGSKERLRLAQEAFGAGIWEWNIKTSEIKWDAQLYAIFGLNPEQDTASFTTWNRLLHPDDLDAANSRIQRSLQEHTLLDSEYRITRPDGQIRWINALGRGFYSEQGEPVWMTGICFDVTERKQTETSLRESEERFRLALRNAPVSVAIQDKDLVFRWAYNQKTVEPEHVIGKTDTDLFTPEDAAYLVQLKRRVIETGNDEHEQVWLTMNGRRLYLDLYLQALRDDKGLISGVGIATVNLTDFKNIELALRESEKRLSEALDLLEAVTKGTDVIIAAQDTTFHYTYFNKAYADEIKRLTGRELSLGMSMIELFSHLPEEQKNSVKEWSKVLSGKSVNARIYFNRQGLPRRTYRVLHTPILDDDGRVIGAGEVAYDITEQARIEHELGETKNYLENLINYANAPIVVWDPEFRITRFNRAFEFLTGRRAKDIIGHHLAILLPKDHLDEAMDLIMKPMTGERWESVEIPILHEEGEIRTVLWNSAPIYGSDGKTIVSIIAQGQDITDRKNFEKELTRRAEELEAINILLNEEIAHRESTDRILKNTLSLLNAALESTADGIIVIDLDGVITSYNKNFSEMWKLDESLLETRDSRLVTDSIVLEVKDPRYFITNMQDLVQHPERESYDMLELQDGRIFERYTKPQKIGGDVVVGRLWSYRDITDRRKAEKGLVASLQEKEILLREIHHRVKNNLQLISGLLDMTRMRTADKSTYNILTDMMLKIQTMAQIHTRLYESKQFGKISLEDQIRDQIAALQAIYSRSGHEIIPELHSPGIYLPVDQAIPVALVVNEILSNAFKHAFKGRRQGYVTISVTQEAGRIRISIKDDGIGLPEEFEIYKAKSLGIKLVRTLVEQQLKGTVKFQSANGAEVIMEFPAGPDMR